MLLAMQRGIIHGLIQDTENLEDIRQREKLLIDIKENISLFTKEQQTILKLFIREIVSLRKDGFTCWMATEVMEQMIIKNFNFALNEYIEILATGAFCNELIEYCLRRLKIQKLGALI